MRSRGLLPGPRLGQLVSRLLVLPDGRWRGSTALVIIALVVAGVSMIGRSLGTQVAPAPPTAADFSEISGDNRPRPVLPPSWPVRVAIGTIGIDAPVEDVDVDTGGTLQAPGLDDPGTVGWYRRGPTPGERGNSVLVGHVDTQGTGPAVFFRLAALRPGDRVTVTRADGSAAAFRVDAVRLFPKSAFPAQLVYGPVPDARLELVTCGGDFDPQRGGYLGNTVVTASLLAAAAR